MNLLCTSTPQAISLFPDIIPRCLRYGQISEPSGELPFAFSYALRCSRSLATLYNEIKVPNLQAAFTTHINNSISKRRFHSFGCELRIHRCFVYTARGRNLSPP